MAGTPQQVAGFALILAVVLHQPAIIAAAPAPEDMEGVYMQVAVDQDFITPHRDHFLLTPVSIHNIMLPAARVPLADAYTQTSMHTHTRTHARTLASCGTPLACRHPFSLSVSLFPVCNL